jgi:hypothetical protein
LLAPPHIPGGPRAEVCQLTASCLRLCGSWGRPFVWEGAFLCMDLYGPRTEALRAKYPLAHFRRKNFVVGRRSSRPRPIPLPTAFRTKALPTALRSKALPTALCLPHQGSAVFSAAALRYSAIALRYSARGTEALPTALCLPHRGSALCLPLQGSAHEPDTPLPPQCRTAPGIPYRPSDLGRRGVGAGRLCSIHVPSKASFPQWSPAEPQIPSL